MAECADNDDIDRSERRSAEHSAKETEDVRPYGMFIEESENGGLVVEDELETIMSEVDAAQADVDGIEPAPPAHHNLGDELVQFAVLCKLVACSVGSHRTTDACSVCCNSRRSGSCSSRCSLGRRGRLRLERQ